MPMVQCRNVLLDSVVVGNTVSFKVVAVFRSKSLLVSCG